MGGESARRVVAAALLLATVLLVHNAAPASACTCAAPPAGDAASRDAYFSSFADAVLVGTATSRVDNPGYPGAATGGFRTYIFDVARVKKGDVGEVAQIRTAGPPDTCGTGFDIGSDYVVYAFRTPEGLETSACSGNRLAVDSDYSPATTRAPSSSSSSSSTSLLPSITEGTAPSSSATTGGTFDGDSVAAGNGPPPDRPDDDGSSGVELGLALFAVAVIGGVGALAYRSRDKLEASTRAP